MDQRSTAHEVDVGRRHARGSSRPLGHVGNATGVADHVRGLEVAEVGDAGQRAVDLAPGQQDGITRLGIQQLLTEITLVQARKEIADVVGDESRQRGVERPARPEPESLRDLGRAAGGALLTDLPGDMHDPHRQADPLAGSELLGAHAIPALVGMGQSADDARSELEALGHQLRRFAVVAVVLCHLRPGEPRGQCPSRSTSIGWRHGRGKHPFQLGQELIVGDDQEVPQPQLVHRL